MNDKYYNVMNEISKEPSLRKIENEDWELSAIKKYFINGIIPKSPEIFEDSLISGVDEDIKTLLDIAVTRISLNQSIKEVVKYIKILESEKNLVKQEDIKHEQEAKYKGGNPYILTKEEELKNENLKSIDENKNQKPSEVINGDLNLIELEIIKEYFKDRTIPKNLQNLDEYLVNPI